MNRKRTAGKLRLCLLTAVFLGITAMMGGNAYAEEKTTTVKITESGGSCRQQVSGSSLFGGLPMMPGSREKAALVINNETGREMYSRLAFVFEGGDRGLYDALTLRLMNEQGAVVYDGPLRIAEYISGPQPGRSKRRVLAELRLPGDADNVTAGVSCRFRLEVTSSDTLIFDPDPSGGSGGGKGGNTGGGSGGGSGSGSGGSGRSGGPGGGSGSGRTGGGTYAVVGGDGTIGPGGDTSVQYDRDGRPLIRSLYDRTNAAAPAKGYAFGGSVTGGGEAKTRPAPDPSLRNGIDSGSWVLADPEKNLWRYCFEDGMFLKSGFALILNPWSAGGPAFRWYCFDDSGLMMIGWIRREGDVWYHSHEESDGDLGAIETGWITGSEDKALYYTNEITAVMVSGWVGFIGADGTREYSYFAALEDTYRQNWFYNTALGRWLYDHLGHRSYGSMYVNETTPDGSTVDKQGKKIS